MTETGRIARAVELWKLFRAEGADPAPFYRRLAADAVAGFDRRYGSLAGKWVADIGCGPGYYTDAFRSAGAVVLPLDGDVAELRLAGEAPDGALVGDAERLPIRSSCLDGVFCSNMLEHTPRPANVIDEMARVLRVGGWGYLSFTNWYSPWGGHEMSPYHLLGPTRGVQLYERRHGADHKHRVGENLYPTHIGGTLELFETHPTLVVERTEPRYYPWAAPIMKVPGAREVLAWNCVVRFTKRSTS